MSGKPTNPNAGVKTFEDQLRKELKAITEARQCLKDEAKRIEDAPDPEVDTAHQTPAGDPLRENQESDKGDPIRRAHEKNLLGLAFSGGGIRSATFNLGVVQGLARLRLLRRVDYLSTVSGGGYIGGWLSSWVHRESAGAESHTSDSETEGGKLGVLDVEKALSEEIPEQGSDSRKEPRQVRWLRQFSNYLTPRVGALGTDTLTGVATYLRNLILNQLILIAFGLSLLLVPWFLVALVQPDGASTGTVALGIAAVLLFAGALLAGYETVPANLGKVVEDAQRETTDMGAERRYWTVVACFALVAVIAGITTTLNPGALKVLWWLFGLAYGVGALIGWWVGIYRQRDQIKPTGADQSAQTTTLQNSIRGIWALLAGLGLGGLLFLWASAVASTEELSSPLPAVVFGPLVVLGAILLTITLHLGLASRGLREAARELWSRHGAHQLRFGVGWLALAGASLIGPLLLMWVNDWIAALGGIAWIATTMAGVLAGSSSTSGTREASKTTEFLARIAPYVFIVGLLLFLSYAQYRFIWTQWAGDPELQGSPRENVCAQRDSQTKPVLYDIAVDVAGEVRKGTVFDAEPAPQCRYDDYIKAGAKLVDDNEWWLLLAALGLFAASLGLSRRVDINVFSLHMFYRNRIERCYMGASNNGRRPHPLTGLDPKDSPRLDQLKLAKDCELGQRPFPIVNTALNITSSRNLAWQERKAASFTFTPMFCGYEIDEPDGQRRPRYQPTEDYVSKDSKWISLGLPITISGAAASPNSGYHTSAATAFLMTVFNVRLGWWLQNPFYAEQWKTSGPKLALFLLIQELSGMTTDASKYVYLSDGGHFENLGIYELVKRRCRYIIACDAGCDPRYGFEDLGNAVRKCQIDLGIDIEIDPRAVRPDAATGRSTFHCAVGIIHYELQDPDGHPGYLLYLKSSLTGDEPADVQQYSAQNPDFPHQTTADQWYSESQFESYRKLGLHTVQKVIADAVETDARNEGTLDTDLEEVFTALRERWYPPSAHVGASFAKQGKTIESVFELIRNDDKLSYLDWQVYPEWRYLMSKAPDNKDIDMAAKLPEDPEQLRAGFYLCNYLLQVMENVYHDLNLEEEYDHPDNRGWMNLFRHWSWAEMFRVTWTISASTYGARFHKFCRRRLNMWLGKVVAHEVKIKDLASSRLNFVEKDLVMRLVDPKTGNQDGNWSLTQLAIQALGPSGEQDSSGAEFPFAFALYKQRNNETVLVYYRVQDHLRKIGLGRMGLAVLYDREPKMKLLAPADRGWISEQSLEADQRQLQRLWDSVAKAPGERGSHRLDARV